LYEEKQKQLEERQKELEIEQKEREHKYIINHKNCSLTIVLTAMYQKLQKS